MPFQDLFDAVSGVRESVARDASSILKNWSTVLGTSEYLSSASNLAHYLALRRHNLTDLQERLAMVGLSSLGRSEGHVTGSLDALLAVLSRLAGQPPLPLPDASLWHDGRNGLDAATRALFGNHGGPPTIMVTLPSEAGDGSGLVERLVEAGMGCARINCAHDGPKTWAAMAKAVRDAARRHRRDCRIIMDLPGPKCRVETLIPEKPDRVHVGDRIRLAVGPRRPDPDMPIITISFPDVVGRLPLDSQVWIDDGKIRARVVRVEDRDRILEVVGARDKGEKLKLEKGVNLPGMPLLLPALGDDDLRALPSIVEHADMIGFSFVQHPDDIDDLDKEITAIAPNHPKMPLALKIETPEAVRNLPRLIVKAAWTRPTAVMIARGDLAVELGHARLAEIQEEILWLCEAARIPAIWATQVLDDLVKEGLPTRAETTDAAMAQRAECVMLNKGPHVVEAIRFLRNVSDRMTRHQSKKTARLTSLHSWPADTLRLGPLPG